VIKVTDLEFVANMLSRRYFAEAAYFGVVSALKAPTAAAHMLAGAGCCGCVEPIAQGQRLLEGALDSDTVGPGGLRVSPATEMPYEGFFHLVQARRLDRTIMAPASLHDVFETVADDLAYFSRRELHTAPDQRRRYSLRMASVSAAVLLRQMSGSDRELPGVAPATLEAAAEIIHTEVNRVGGDAAFFD
jgi:hypothetical protein